MSDTVPRPRGGAPDDLDEAPLVRPYTVTGGRTRVPERIPIEALVESLTVEPPTVQSQPWAGGPERRAILCLLVGRYLSVAEISAHLRLPVGVARVLVCDLSDEGSVRVHGLSTSTPDEPAARPHHLSILERVLDGIAAL